MGVRIYFSHLLEDADMKRAIEVTGAGVEAVYMSVGDNLDRFESSLKSYKKTLEKLGNPPLIIHGAFLDLNPAAFDTLVRRATRFRFEQCYMAARYLGAKRLVFHTGFDPAVYFKESYIPRAVEFFGEFMSGKGEDIIVTVENVLDRDPDAMKALAEGIKHPAWGLAFDVGHAHCYSKVELSGWMEALTPHIRHLHLHDNDSTQDAHLALGAGTIPLEQIKNIIDTNPVDTLTIENNSVNDVLQSYEIIRKTLLC